jgi:hypothetical protein
LKFIGINDKKRLRQQSQYSFVTLFFLIKTMASKVVASVFWRIDDRCSTDEQSSRQISKAVLLDTDQGSILAECPLLTY